MQGIGMPFVSGRWTVKPGSEDEFVTRWTAFTQWSLDNAKGARGFYLLRDEKEPNRFVSLGYWDDKASIGAWRQSPEFAEKLGRARELCDEFEARDYALAAQIG